MRTTITNARIFDGERVLSERTVVIDDAVISALGAAPDRPDEPLPNTETVDAAGMTLLPGLLDAHVHTSPDALRLAVTFGVTTELEMGGVLTAGRRDAVTDNDELADVRSSGFGITPPGGHPSEIIPDGALPGPDDEGGRGVVMPFARTPAEAIAFIPRLIASGSDYIKFLIDDGTTANAPGLPVLDRATLNAGVAEAHRLGMLTVAHTLTVDATRMAVEAGIDGLVHLFMDQPHTPEIIDLIAGSGAFVVPCVVLNASIMGITGERFAADPRVHSRLSRPWLATLKGSFHSYPQGRLPDVLASVRALHEAGVTLLAGTDASVPVPTLGGLAHGASVHHELQMLVAAGLSPSEALSSATMLPARRFSLHDRGRITEGLRADLLLVKGDPTADISDTLNIEAVWRRGIRIRLG